MTQVFIDSSVFFAGFFSQDGASASVLGLARRGKISIFANRIVLREVDRNLRLKASPRILKAFHRFLHETKIQITPPLSEDVLSDYESTVHPKDVPILASAVEAGVDFLITLDRRHFLTSAVSAKSKKTKILIPGDFLRKWIKLIRA